MAWSHGLSVLPARTIRARGDRPALRDRAFPGANKLAALTLRESDIGVATGPEPEARGGPFHPSRQLQSYWDGRAISAELSTPMMSSECGS